MTLHNHKLFVSRRLWLFLGPFRGFLRKIREVLGKIQVTCSRIAVKTFRSCWRTMFCGMQLFCLLLEASCLQWSFFSRTVDNFSFFTYSFSFSAYSWSFFVYSGKVRLIRAVRDCKQRSLNVSKKASTVSKKDSPCFVGSRLRNPHPPTPRKGPVALEGLSKRVDIAFLWEVWVHHAAGDNGAYCAIVPH